MRLDEVGVRLVASAFAVVLVAATCSALAGPPQGEHAVEKDAAGVLEWEGAVYWEGHLCPHMQQKPDWYASAEAVRIADNVLLYQCDSGGWPKTLSFKKRYNVAAIVSDADRPALVAAKSRTDSTIDNGSTYTQMEYLARVFNATKQERFKVGFLKGVDYLLKAQYENGGWPQFYPTPKDKAYFARIAFNHDAKDYYADITFNDEAMVNVLRLLQRIARDKPMYAFVDAERRAQCGKAVVKGVDCILKCQVVVDGKRTGWCAQHDKKTFAPTQARVYEKVSLSGHEGVGVVRFLMSLDAPSPAVVDAVQSAVAWFDSVKIKGLRLVDKEDSSVPGGRDRVVVADPAADPLWARFYEIGTNRPIFCGNDGVVKRNMAEVEYERRNGYMWYCTSPAELLAKAYPAWQKKCAPGTNVLLVPSGTEGARENKTENPHGNGVQRIHHPVPVRSLGTPVLWAAETANGKAAANGNTVFSERSASIRPLPFKVSAALPDVAEVLSPSAVRIDGWLGTRITANEKHRLLVVDTEPLLAGFHKKPGSHPWIGEHVGKWMHAATLAWANTGDPALREKLDRVAAELIATQEPDGYLGTYLPKQRFGLFKDADWDVWSHKYNLLGLLTYYQYTGNEAVLTACRRMGDLLIATFPAKKSILAAGTHMGMAATSVLEPMVLLYRCTGDKRYLDFCRYIVKSWDEPNGPKIITTLLAQKSVNRTANAKAYEMLSNLVGLCELARATGDRTLLEPVLNAWADIVANRLYLTGSASAGEHFQADHVLPNEPHAHICETCVTVTWIQLNLQLLRLTGDAKFGDEPERSFYNHLAAAQHPRGDDWCYYTALEGTKKYDKQITCCHSSGPRGFALAPQAAYLRGKDALLVDTLETSLATLELGGQTVTVEQQSEFPQAGASILTLKMSGPARFAIKIRVPGWAAPLTAESATVKNGWAELPLREWKDGDRVAVKFNLAERIVAGEHGNAGRSAMARGPFVLARVMKTGAMLPFAEAGADGGAYCVWLRKAAAGSDSLLIGGSESRSRPGNADGSINDEDVHTYVVTYNGKPAAEDWFAVTLAKPVTVARVLYAHGKTFHDGGWFDASAGKPRIQIQISSGGDWKDAGELQDYPATTGANSGNLREGDTFTCLLSSPVKVFGVRVMGKPSFGCNPNQAFSSCGELQAFAK